MKFGWEGDVREDQVKMYWFSKEVHEICGEDQAKMHGFSLEIIEIWRKDQAKMHWFSLDFN